MWRGYGTEGEEPCFLRPDGYRHDLVRKGGVAPEGRLLFLPIHDTQKLSESFRRAFIKLFISKRLITEEFGSTLVCRNPRTFPWTTGSLSEQ
jgi:hypothetical protein